MKHEIEIEGLPEGWEPVAYAVPCIGDHVFNCGRIKLVESKMVGCWLIVKKKQPRRIVLEETGEDNIINHGAFQYQCPVDFLTFYNQPKIWREVKESDLSLNNADDKESLRLSVDECKEIFHCKTANTMNKIRNFLKDK